MKINLKTTVKCKKCGRPIEVNQPFFIPECQECGYVEQATLDARKILS